MTLHALRTHTQPPVFSTMLTSGRAGAKRLLHIGVHNSANRNAGDTLLFPVVRHAFDSLIGPFDWELRQAWQAFDLEDAQRANRDFDGVVIGGGGLLLRDQAGSDVSRSGWQWNSSVEAVQALRVPLIVFAIGYNRFRGQPDFDPVFTDHLRAVAERAPFFGLRNSGSIQALQRYLPDAQAARLRRQFCPTNVLWQLYPEHRRAAQQHDAGQNQVLAFNAAFDRAGHRFGDAQQSLLARVAHAVRSAQDRGWRIVNVAHKSADREIEPYLDAAEVDYDTEDLTDADPDAVMAFYARVDLAFGMRGHAQMIPFGLRRPILSLISHDKMRFLLDDIQRPAWGVEVDNEALPQTLARVLHRLETERAAVHAEIAVSQQAVWEETRGNLDWIDRTLLHPGGDAVTR